VPRAAIAAENLALRQQLAVLRVSVKRSRLRKRDRIFWVWLNEPVVPGGRRGPGEWLGPPFAGKYH
jgi:hypothetical protein